MVNLHSIHQARKLWMPFLLIAFAVALLAPYTLSAFLLTGDVRDTYLPIEDFYRTELRAERLPSWDPNTAMGFPVLASAQTGFWQFPLLLFRPWMSPEHGYAAAYLFHGILLALGMYAYARSLSLSRSGAALATLAFTGSGFIVGHLVHGNIFFGIAWMPCALLFTDRLAASLRLRPLLLLACVLALATLPGHFHIAGMIMILVLVRLFAQLRTQHPSVPFAHTLWMFGLLALPLLALWLTLTAAQLFPTLELIRESTRGSSGGFDLGRANQHSFPLWQLVTFVIPAFFGFPDLSEYWGTRPQIEMTAWVGTLPFLFALFSLISVRIKDREGSSARFWVLVALVGFLFALGRWSPLRLLGVEPTLGVFSSPARYLLFTQFSLALLAGIGLDRLVHQPRRSRLMGWFGVLSVFAVGAGFGLLKSAPEFLRGIGASALDQLIIGKPGHVLPREDYLQKIDYVLERASTWGVNLGNPLILLSAGILFCGGVLLLYGARRRVNASFLRAVVVGVTAFELMVIAWQVHPRVSWSEVFAESPVVQTLRERPWARLVVVHPQGDTGLYFANPTTPNREEHEKLLRNLAVANIFTRSGIPSIEWSAALDLAGASDLLSQLRDAEGRPINEDLFDRFSVRYVAGSTRTPELHLLPPAREILTFNSAENATIRVWERPTVRPRIELFSSLPKDVLSPLPQTTGTAMVITETPQRLSIGVRNETDRNAALVVRDSWYPGWHATLDGVSVPIERTESIFRGVLIPPGIHVLTMEYQPKALYVGMTVSGIVLSGVAFLLLLPSLKRRAA